MDSPIRLTLARKPTELKQILALQRENLLNTISEEEAREQGFLTARHEPDVLARMNANTPAAIVKQGRRVLGYALAMTSEFAEEIPVLQPLIAQQDWLLIDGRPLGEATYLNVGQLCVGKEIRGKRYADRLYKYLRGCYHPRFEYLVTGIRTDNTRSLRVHQRVGFREVDEFTDENGYDWVNVVWAWRP